MTSAVLFKILQRQNKFRNSKGLLSLPQDFCYSKTEFSEALQYLMELDKLQIKFTYPGDQYYPKAFLKMNEPPLFLEYMGEPFWTATPLLSVVGSRKIHALSVQWMKKHLQEFVAQSQFRIVSGGAIGVDLLAHTISVIESQPTAVVLPSGLSQIYPQELGRLAPRLIKAGGVLISEFEHRAKPRKEHFFFRNRLIAALGEMTLVVQAQTRSGTFLTVHHALQNGRPVMVVPTHPEIDCFSGNLILIQDGAIAAYNTADLISHLQTEIQFGTQPHQLFSV